MKLLKEKLKSGLYIICKNEYEANALTKLLALEGYKWYNGARLDDYSGWDDYSSSEGLAYIIFDTENKKIKCNPDMYSTIRSKVYLGFEEIITLDEIPQLPEIKKDIIKPSPLAEAKITEPAKIEKSRKENVKMNMFGFDFECGLCEDSNISSTIMGIAVKNGNSWKIFDKSSNSMIDIGDIDMGSFPIYILPSTKLKVGDIIKQNGQYLNITEVSASSVKAINCSTGKIEDIVPVRNILGMSFYSKLLVFTDSLMDEGDEGDTDILLLSFLVQGNKPNDDDTACKKNKNNFLFFWLLMSKDNEDSDDCQESEDYDKPKKKSKKDKLMKAMMLSMAMGNSGNNQDGMMMALLMKDKLF